MITIRCCHALEDAAPHRSAMNALNLASARPDPFSTFEFYGNYLRNAARAQEAARLWLLLAFRGDTLVGYAALKQSRRRVLGLHAVKLEWLTAHAADRPHLVAHPDEARAVAAALYTYLLGRKSEWSLLEFQQQEVASPLLPPPADAVAGTCRFRQWPNAANATVALQWRSTAGYFSALSKKSRSNVSRQMRTLLAAGDVQLLTSSDPQTVRALFALYRGAEAHSWKARTEAGFGSDAGWIEHYTGLMDPSQPMKIVIQVLLLDGAPIAGLICGAFDKGLYALHIVYDERLARLAPGSAILLMGARLAIEGGYQFFNLLRGSGYYKTRWLAEMSETQSLQVYRAGSLFFWHRALGDLRRRWSRKTVAQAPEQFNPERRGNGHSEPVATTPAATVEENARHAALVAQVRLGPGEFLSAAQLAAVLPFDCVRHRADEASAPA